MKYNVSLSKKKSITMYFTRANCANKLYSSLYTPIQPGKLYQKYQKTDNDAKVKILSKDPLPVETMETTESFEENELPPPPPAKKQKLEGFGKKKPKKKPKKSRKPKRPGRPKKKKPHKVKRPGVPGRQNRQAWLKKKKLLKTGRKKLKKDIFNYILT